MQQWQYVLFCPFLSLQIQWCANLVLHKVDNLLWAANEAETKLVPCGSNMPCWAVVDIKNGGCWPLHVSYTLFCLSFQSEEEALQRALEMSLAEVATTQPQPHRYNTRAALLG